MKVCLKWSGRVLSGVGVRQGNSYSVAELYLDSFYSFLNHLLKIICCPSFAAVSSTSVSGAGDSSEGVGVGVESVEWEQVGPKNKSAITRQVSCDCVCVRVWVGGIAVIDCYL